MTVISDYVFMSSFCVRPSMGYRKRLHGVYISMFCIVVALPINTRFVSLICAFSLFIMKQQQKLSSFIYAKEDES